MKRADVIALGAAGLLVLGTVAGSALARERPARMERMAAASGVLALSNSRAGGAIVNARGLVPGRSASGTITLGNTGEVPGTLALLRTGIDDRPGPNGGRLSNVLTLLIEDVSGARPREVAYGKVRDLRRIALEPLPGGARRTYRFTVEFPDSGPHGADNAYIGSRLRMDYEWRAEALPATSLPGRAPQITIRVPHQSVMHTHAVRLFARCDVACTVRYAGRAERLGGVRLFRGERKPRALPVTSERGLALELTRRGRRALRRELDSRGRVAVVITASVRGPNGARTVRKRIVLHTTLIRDGRRISYR